MTTQQFILLGPPGVGVREHAALLAERWQIPHVSFPALLPEREQQDPAIAAALSDPVTAAASVPDDVAMKLMRRRFEQPDTVLKGWVLDGFPATVAQAQAFDQWWSAFGKPAPQAIYLKAMSGILINRLAMKAPPDEPISAIRQRLAQHDAAIAPVLADYQARSQLQTINASLSFAEVARSLAQLGIEPAANAARVIRDEAELDTFLAQESLLVVDCMASWCGSCQQVTPSIDKLATTYSDRVTVTKIDFDVNRQITKRFGLKGIPAVMFFKHGERLETLTGVKSYQEYNAAIARLLD